MKKKTMKRKPSYFSLHKGMFSVIAGGLLGFILLAPVGAQFIRTIEIPIAIRLVGITAGFEEDEFDEILGASTEHSFSENFNVGLFSAGFKDADATIPTLASTGSTDTLTAAEVCANPVGVIGFPTATGTVTLPTPANFKSNGTCLKDLGDRIEFALYNASTTGQFDLAAGASSSIAKLNTSSTDANAFATSSVPAQGIVEITGRRITSSTDYILWNIKVLK